MAQGLKRNVSFFIGSNFVGTISRDPALVHAELAPIQGLAFFCPICCEVWFRALSEGEPSTVYHRFCGIHSPGTSYGCSSLGHVWDSDIPGSLWRVEDVAWNRSLPPEALTYELRVSLIWLQHFVKEDTQNLIQEILLSL